MKLLALTFAIIFGAVSSTNLFSNDISTAEDIFNEVFEGTSLSYLDHIDDRKHNVS